MVVTNYPITSRDTSQALIRRMRVFPTELVYEGRRSLISFTNGQWCGPLSKELPGIFNLVCRVKEPMF